MSAAQHIEWLSLIETTGPFLAVGVLDEAFPQDLESVETLRRQRVRKAYEEWSEAVETNDPQLLKLHREWINLILSELLEYEPSILKSGEEIPAFLTYREPMSGSEVKPEFAIISAEKAHLLICCYPPDTNLTSPMPGESWAASPIERMITLCRATGVRVGLVTNGELWSLVSVPADGSTSIGTWYARIWQQEPLTLRAFVSLPGVRRFFGQTEGTLETLFAKSLEHQDGVTDTLGEQVRRAIEVLVQALDRADIDRNRELLKDVSPTQLYEAGLTVMMRLVVLLCAEERKLLLLGDPVYDQNYAVSTLRSRLLEDREQFGEEVLERRHDAWSRLLALFRGVYGGIDFEGLRLPPLGGSLFDPDRFPFLEGRLVGSSWHDTAAEPLPIDNRTVLLLLNALQVLEQRAGAQLLSYEALDVEQVGHVYEGLLERTVMRVPKVTLGIVGSKKSVNPTAPLSELEKLSPVALQEFLTELTGRSDAAIRNALSKFVDEEHYNRILLACGNDSSLADRVRPYAHLLRLDSWGDPLIYPEGAFIVAMSSGRRETGAHYTPKALTEPIVHHTLEPLVYVGPSEGLPQDQWRLKSPSELLALKVCDMAMGSAAFLVQTCRWLGERLVESWDTAERKGKAISIEGEVLDTAGGAELLPQDKGERILIARRLIASRCLYGVDINPMAVELAKLSLWLITLMKGRPFGFLDHALKCGDALLGVNSLQQVVNFSLKEGDRQTTFGTANLPQLVEEASEKRRQLESLPSNDFTQIEQKKQLFYEAAEGTAKVKALADCLIAFELRGLDGRAYEEQMTEQASRAAAAMNGAKGELQSYATSRLEGRRPFHWAVEFPEVFAKGGFDAFVGNPPFLGGRKIRGVHGGDYLNYLVSVLEPNGSGNADFCTFFFLRAFGLLNSNGNLGLIAPNTIAEGDSRATGLERMIARGGRIYCADDDREWPGVAGITVAVVHVSRSTNAVVCLLENKVVEAITPSLKTVSVSERLKRLVNNENRCFQGSVLAAKGFILSLKDAHSLLKKDQCNREVIVPYYTGDEVFNLPLLTPQRMVINFKDWSREKAEKYLDAFRIVEATVQPVRALVNRASHREKWWHYGDKRPALYSAISGLKRALVQTHHTKFLCPQFAPTDGVFSHSVVVFPTDDYAVYLILNCNLHDAWARETSGSIRSELRYTPTDCLYTFPFPEWNHDDPLSIIGKRLDARRSEMKLSLAIGITELMNVFHDPSQESYDMAQLRALHVDMDQAVAAAYGWNDLDLGHGFHETKQGVRFTINETARREVLDRLLALNHQRYAEEVAAGLHEKKRNMASGGKRAGKVDAGNSAQELKFD